MSHTIEGLVVTEQGIVRGRLHFDHAIRAIEPDERAADDVIVVPGFIDLHVHGGGGGDVMEGSDAVETMAAFHALHGTTTLLATTVTAPADDIEAAFAGIASAMAGPRAEAAEIAGVHLEGPFISPDALGAQPPFPIPPDIPLIERLHAIAPIRVATYAPEIDEGDDLLRWMTAAGTRAQIGHSTCGHERAAQALDRGAAGFTHLYNAMSGMHHRKPGIVGCALAHARHAEIIPDLLHAEATAVKAALRAIPELYAITDAVSATGMPDGEYRLGQHRITKLGDAVRLADGGLAGSVLTMDRAFANLVALGCSIEEASRRTATVQAAYLGLEDRAE